MDYFQKNLLFNGLLSLMVFAYGLYLVDRVLSRHLALSRRLAFYAGILIMMSGLSFFVYKLHRYGEFYTIKSAAEYHETISCHARKWALTHSATNSNESFWSEPNENCRPKSK